MIYKITAGDLTVFHNPQNQSWSDKILPEVPLVKRRYFGKNEKPTSIQIILGTACNMSCTYCSQQDQDVSKNFDETLEKHISLNHLEKVTIWGGEPLAYKTFKRTVLYFKERSPKVKIVTITNGTLLDNDNTKFLIDNNVHFAISHDGPMQHLRGINPLDIHLYNIKKMVNPNQANIASIKATITNATVTETYNYFKDLLGFDFAFSSSPIRVHHEHNIDMWYPKKENLDKIHEDLYESLINDTCKDKYALSNLGNIISASRTERNLSSVTRYGSCTAHSRDGIAIDMNGNVVTCHVDTDPIGTLSNLHDIKAEHDFRDGCRACLVFSACRGSCAVIKPEHHDLNCSIAYSYFSAIFKAAFYKMYGREITNVEKLGDLPC